MSRPGTWAKIDSPHWLCQIEPPVRYPPIATRSTIGTVHDPFERSPVPRQEAPRCGEVDARRVTLVVRGRRGGVPTLSEELVDQLDEPGHLGVGVRVGTGQRDAERPALGCGDGVLQGEVQELRPALLVEVEGAVPTAFAKNLMMGFGLLSVVVAALLLTRQARAVVEGLGVGRGADELRALFAGHDVCSTIVVSVRDALADGRLGVD